MGSACVNGGWIHRIEGQRGDVPHLQIVFRRDSSPGLTGPGAEVNTLRSSGRKHTRIRGRECQGFNTQSAERGQGLPMLTAIAAFIHSRIGRVAGIQTSIKMAAGSWIDDQRVDGPRSSRREWQQPPGGAGIVRPEYE